MYVLNLAEDNRILSACIMLEKQNYNNMPIVDTLPNGNLSDYIYVDGKYIYSPLPNVDTEIAPTEIAPTDLERIEAQVIYTAMMTDTLLEV